jgi:hypothetical protein
MRRIAPGQRSRALKIELLGDVIRKRASDQLILRSVEKIAAILSDERWLIRMAKVHR